MFNEEVMKALLSAWRVYDPTGSGMMPAKDYISFLLNLKPPVSLNKDEIKKLLKATADSLKYTYREGYPNQVTESIVTTPRSEKAEHMELVTRRIFIESRDRSIKFTVEDFCNFCRVYNVPLYKHNQQQ